MFKVEKKEKLNAVVEWWGADTVAGITGPVQKFGIVIERLRCDESGKIFFPAAGYNWRVFQLKRKAGRMIRLVIDLGEELVFRLDGELADTA